MTTSKPKKPNVAPVAAAFANGPRVGLRFRSKLFRYPGPGGWTFARIPARHAPPVTHGWGRTPVLAQVDGVSWETSVWHDRKYGTLLAVPKRVRGQKADGDSITIELLPSRTRV